MTADNLIILTSRRTFEFALRLVESRSSLISATASGTKLSLRRRFHNIFSLLTINFPPRLHSFSYATRTAITRPETTRSRLVAFRELCGNSATYFRNSSRVIYGLTRGEPWRGTGRRILGGTWTYVVAVIFHDLARRGSSLARIP